MDEYRNLVGGLGAGLVLAGFGGYVAAEIARLAGGAKTGWVANACLGGAFLGVLLVLGVLVRIFVLNQHRRHLSNLTKRGNALYGRIQALDLKTDCGPLTDEFQEWIEEVEDWLDSKFPGLSGHFRNEGAQRPDWDVIAQHVDLRLKAVDDMSRVHYLEVLASGRLNRLGEITLRM